ncbi:MAG: type II toxin-antitoxin system HicB family antitoxin [Alphaproteobacteria bacterium]|nr:type II toxin-antitoxin system HicB family antitoxin [Alphaproteobacteria bacterium]
MSYAIVIVPLSEEDGGGFVGFVPDLRGCMSDGETREEAIRNTEDAMTEWLDLHKRTGRPIPEAGSAVARVNAKQDALIAAVHALSDYADEVDEKIEKIEDALRRIIEMTTTPIEYSSPIIAAIAVKKHRSLLTH